MVNHDQCMNLEPVFELIGKKWTGLIIHALLKESKRFSELHTTIPSLNARMLSERLKELEEKGIVRRTVYPTTPVRIEYGLTEKGKALEPALLELSKWADDWIHD
ncbi:putative transcriptional regulator [Bacillus sp. TS-2]|nr:putative transcriptional regulator [Bacillus sp. TS-2]